MDGKASWEDLFAKYMTWPACLHPAHLFQNSDAMPKDLSLLKIKFRRLLNQFVYLPRALELAWVAARWWTVAGAALLVIQGLLPVATVYLTRSVVDNIVAAVKTGGTRENVAALSVPVML